MFWRKELRPEQLLRVVPLLGSKELGSGGDALREIRKRAWRTTQSHQRKISLTSEDTLQERGLTSCYLPRLFDLLTSTA